MKQSIQKISFFYVITVSICFYNALHGMNTRKVDTGLLLKKPTPSGPMPRNMTQTESHKYMYNDLIQHYYPFGSTPFYQKLYDEVTSREKQYSRTHYAFYNAYSNDWRVPQDIYLKLYERLSPLTLEIENFRTFRWFPVDHTTAEAFIKKEMSTSGLVLDTKKRLKEILLSTNLALFGNVGFFGECTFEYFLNAKSKSRMSVKVYQGLLDIFDNLANYAAGEEPFLYKYIPEMYELEKYLEANPLPLAATPYSVTKDGAADQTPKTPQTLAQIFIPKKIVNEVAYVSFTFGIPYDQELADWIVREGGGARGEFGEILPSWEATGPIVKKIKGIFKDKEKHPAFQRVLKGIEQGKYHISRILDTYKTNPISIPGMNYLQARIILTPLYVGSPSSGIKTFTYDALTDAQKQQYENALNALIDKMVREFLAYNSQKS